MTTGRPRARARPRSRRPSRDPAAWQADVVPIAITLGDDPAARPAMTIVTCRGRILSGSIVARPPADAGGIAELIARMVVQIVTSDGGNEHAPPTTIEVRHPDVAARLPGVLGTLLSLVPAPRVLPNDDLDQVDDAVASYDQNVVGRDPALGRRPRMSHPATWAGWGLPSPLIARFFAAAATYYRAAPWRRLTNDDLLRLTLPRGAVWTAAVMGDARELFGLALYERLDDHLAILSGPLPEEAFGAVQGAVLSMSFGSREEAEQLVQLEVLRNRWEIAGGNAWPDLFAINTLGGGIAEEWMEDLILTLRAIPRFAKRFVPPPGAAHDGPFVLEPWTDAKSGVTIELVRTA